MKKLLTGLILIFVFNIVAKAQTPEVKIVYYIDSAATFSNCSPPFTTFMIIHGQATGINATIDSLEYLISWGDGTTTGGIVPFATSGSTSYWNIGNPWDFFHTYTTSGIFDYKLLFWSKLTGAKDSLMLPNFKIIGTHCDSITGNFYKDLNSDCQYNTGEPLMSNLLTTLSLYSGNTLLNSFYNFNYIQSNGYFSLSVPDGIPGMPLYKIKVNNTAAFPGICPVNGEYVIQNLPSVNNDFGFQCNNTNDFGINITNAMVGFSNLSGRIYFNLINVSCIAGTSTVKIILDPKTHLGNYSYPTNSSVITALTGDTIVYNNITLNSFQTQNFIVNLTVIPGIIVGDTLSFKTMVTPQISETNLLNNNDSIAVKVVASYDPNDIQVSPFGFIPNLTKLNYTVRFQNTGNATATRVVIIDTLDANLDINSLSFKGSSHDVDMVKLANNIVKFVFEPINLPDSGSYLSGSMGYVAFSVKPIGYLPIGTEIPNTAYIYFDENPSIQTNIVINTIDSIMLNPDGVSELENANTGMIYPNPASKFIQVNFNEELKDASVAIYDMSGRMVYSQLCNEKTFQIPLISFENGFYLIQLRNKGYLKQQKLTISH